MKKALVILMALSMVFAAFADEPAAVNEIAEFTGNATVTWGVDLDAKSVAATGFKNTAAANLKINLASAGTKSTTGDGVWGEISIKLGDDPVTVNFDSAGTKTTAWGVSVASAKLHITDMFAISILKGDVQNGGYNPVLAADSDQDTLGVGAFGGSDSVTQGITLEVSLPDLLAFNIDFRSEDNGRAKAVDGDDAKSNYTDNYGIAFDVDVKAVENLTLKAGYGMDFFGAKAKGLFAQAAYKAGLDDKFYIQPQVAFGSDLDNVFNLSFGALFGWGGTNADPIKYMNKKVSDGFSVATTLKLKDDPMAIPLCVAVYDSTFVENLKAGIEFHMNNVAKFSDAGFTLAFDTTYNLGVLVPTFALKFGQVADLLNIYFACDYTGIANTTFTVGYESGNLRAATAQIGQLWVSAKISF